MGDRKNFQVLENFYENYKLSLKWKILKNMQEKHIFEISNFFLV